MLILSHLGLGSKIVSPWSRRLPIAAVLVGTLLPDLIDKPVYYVLCWITGENGAWVIQGTRTFAHSLLFLAALAIAATIRKSRILAGLVLGVTSHLVLDVISIRLSGESLQEMLVGILFPFFGAQFPVATFSGVAGHLQTTNKPYLLWGEAIGGAILAWDYWKKRYLREMIRDFREQRVLARQRLGSLRARRRRTAPVSDSDRE